MVTVVMVVTVLAAAVPAEQGDLAAAVIDKSVGSAKERGFIFINLAHDDFRDF